MKKKQASFQVKVLGIVLVAMLVPIGWANYILYKTRMVTDNLSPIIGIRNVVTQFQANNPETWRKIQDLLTQLETPGPDTLRTIKENLADQEGLRGEIDTLQIGIDGLTEYISQNSRKLENLDKGIQSLGNQARFFMLGSVIMLVSGAGLLWMFLNLSTLSLKDLLTQMALFQNEDPQTKTADFALAVTEFENLLQTTKTVLSETYSLSKELAKKIEPLTTVSVFSDENVGHFFTDVQEISRSSNYIANTLESTTASIQEVSTSAQTIADRSSKAAHDSSETADIANQGRQAVTDTVNTMQNIKDEVLGLEDVIANLNSASKEIGEIVNTITNIAYQTNLLALNAAIEAARAGEHGQGFTVVADEVRKLAEESGEAAEDIGKKIKGMLQKTGNAVQTINQGTAKVIEGVKVANDAGNNLVRIVNSVSNVNQMIQDISNASKEQSVNIESLRASIESISGATRITSEGTKRVAAAVNEQLNYIRQYISAVKELQTLVEILGGMLEKFNFQ